MSDFSTGGSAVVFATSGTAVSFSLAPATDAFTVSPVTTPGAHASTHGAAGSDPITTLGTVAVTSLSGTASTVAFGSGSAGTPSVTFTGDSNTGIYSSAADTVAITTAGTARVTVGSTGQITAGTGTAGTPTYSITGDTNTGIYSPGADQVGIATAGTARVVVGSTGLVGIGDTTGAAVQVHLNYDSAAQLRIQRNSTDVTGGQLAFVKQRGTNASPTVVGAADGLGQVSWYGYDGGSRVEAARLSVEVDATPGSGDMPTRLLYYLTPDGTTTLTERMRIDNAGLITGTGTSLGAWTSYTPTLGGFTLGDGTWSAAYMRIGKVCIFRAVLTFGSTTIAASAFPTFTLPVTAAATTNVALSAQFFDTSASAYYTAASRQSSTTVVTIGIIGGSGAHTTCTTTTPFTWATGDQIILTGTYEIA